MAGEAQKVVDGVVSGIKGFMQTIAIIILGICYLIYLAVQWCWHAFIACIHWNADPWQSCFGAFLLGMVWCIIQIIRALHESNVLTKKQQAKYALKYVEYQETKKQYER